MMIFLKKKENKSFISIEFEFDNVTSDSFQQVKLAKWRSGGKIVGLITYR